MFRKIKENQDAVSRTQVRQDIWFNCMLESEKRQIEGRETQLSGIELAKEEIEIMKRIELLLIKIAGERK